MNTHEKSCPKPIHPMAPIATALSVMLLAACSVPVQVPIQTKPQQPPAFVDELKQQLPAPNGGVPAIAPTRLPALAPVIAPTANPKADQDLPDRHPTATTIAPTANPKASEGDFDRLPRLTPVVPVTKQKAGEDLRDRHPQLYPGGPRVNLRADEELIDSNPSSLVSPAPVGQASDVNDDFAQNPHRKVAAPQVSPKAANGLNARHPRLYPGGPRVNLRADEDLLDLTAAPSRNRGNTPDEVSDGHSRR